MDSLASSYPVRTPGSDSDKSLADAIGSALAADHFAVSQSGADVRTARGTRTLQTVTGTRAGLTNGTMVVVAHRDGPGEASLSGTSTLLELANALGGETLEVLDLAGMERESNDALKLTNRDLLRRNGSRRFESGAHTPRPK